VGNGELDKDSYENYLKMEKEKTYFESTVSERRNRDKGFGKMLKNFKKIQKKNDF
jgi:ribosome biogenesis GTPase